MFRADLSERRVNENDALAALHLLTAARCGSEPDATLKGFIKPLTKER